MKSKIVFLISLILILIIIDRLGKIYDNNKVFIDPLKRDYLDFHKSGDLTYFYEPKPGIHSIKIPWENTNGPQNPKYRINSDTLNQVNDLSATKPPGVFRIAVLGDSFTFGLNVNTQDNYSSRLQNLISSTCKKNKIEVINLGVEGYDIAYMLERYRLRGKKYNPDLLLWLVIGDDLRRFNEKRIPKLSNLFSKLRQKEKNAQVPQNTEFIIKSDPLADQILKEIGEDKILTMQKENLNKMRKYFSKSIVLSTFPHEDKRYGAFFEEFLSSHKNYFWDNNLPDIYFDFGTALPDRHPSPKGHKLISQNLFNYILENKLIPCER